MNNMNDVLEQESLKLLKKYYSESKTGHNIVFFIGSGLSKEAGLPDWKELTDKLTVECRKTTENNAFSQRSYGHLLSKLNSEPDYWEKFQYIKEILGNTTYSSAIRRLLSTDGAAIPKSYKLLCGLKGCGYISLNIDDLLTKAMQDAHHEIIYPVYGLDAERRIQDLIRNRPYIYQPHGFISTESSWIFTKSEFNKLCETSLHKSFLTSTFLMDIVVFIGIRATDVGATLRLINLVESGINTRSHFWITSDSHMEDRDWAEKNGIQQIIYPARLGHSPSLEAIIQSIKSHRELDKPILTPVVGQNNYNKSPWDIPPNDLFKFDNIDEIRLTLNEIIKHKTVNGEISYSDYTSICESYERAIHSCYMLPKGRDGEKWFDYEITGKYLGGKTIGRVFPARDQNNNPIAIKILDQKRYSDEVYLSAFRRGIKALKILRDRNVNGTVRIVDAYELPPTIVMDFLNCASLNDAIINARLSPLSYLSIMRDVSSIVMQAHLLPETVLHRDIRPSNILLDNFDWTTNDFDSVKVIDFDLAWHKGATGDDLIQRDREALGYQAPEQLSNGENSLRRTTLIDSFGIGATLYFCISGQNPEVNITKDKNWGNHISTLTHRAFNNNKELCAFLARIITKSMAADASQRLPVTEINYRIIDIINWLSNNESSCSMDFLSEMLCSASCPSIYNVDNREKLFLFETTTGLSINIKYNFLDKTIDIEIDYMRPPNTDFGRTSKAMGKLNGEFNSYFSALGECRTKFNINRSDQFMAKVVIPECLIKQNFWLAADAIKKIIRSMNIHH